MTKKRLAKEMILPGIVLIITVQLAIPLFHSTFMASYAEPISIQQYRGAGAMGVLVGMCILCIVFAVSTLIKSILRYRSGLSTPYLMTWSNEGEKLLADLQEKSKMSLAEVMNAALATFADLVDQEQYIHKIRTQMAKKPTPDFIKIVVDNTKRNKDN